MILESEIHFAPDGKLTVQREKNAFAMCRDEPIPVISATPLTAAGLFFFSTLSIHFEADI